MDKKNEAIKRMKKLGLMKEVIDAFKKGGENSLYYSERINKMMPAVLYWVDNEEMYVKAVKEFEEKYDALVYHCILTHTADWGDLLDMLYVSNNEEEWKYDNEGLNDGYVYVNSVNISEEMYSEIGAITVRPIMGGLERIA